MGRSRYEHNQQEIMALLSEGEYGAKDISKIIRISEKVVCTHLDHRALIL